MKITLRDVKLTLLFTLGFAIAYAEGYFIQCLNNIYFPNGSEFWRPIAWMIFFGIFHSMLLFKIFRGGRFNWEW